MESHLDLISNGIIYLDNGEDIFIPLSKRNKWALLTRKLHFSNTKKQIAVWALFKNIVELAPVAETNVNTDKTIHIIFENATLSFDEYNYIFNTVFYVLNEESIVPIKGFFTRVIINAFNQYCELLNVDFTCDSNSYKHLNNSSKLSIISHLMDVGENNFLFTISKQRKHILSKLIKLAGLLDYGLTREWILLNPDVISTLNINNGINISLLEIINSLSATSLFHMDKIKG